MKPIVIMVGAAALLLGPPTFAKPGHGHGYGHSGPQGVGVGGCPPGLAKKAIPCVPPGQAKKLYNVGQRFPRGYGTQWDYGRIPYDLRTRYGLRPYGSYYYGDGYLYRVDPKTMLIQQVVGALLSR